MRFWLVSSPFVSLLRKGITNRAHWRQGRIVAAAPCIYTAVKVSEGESGSLNQSFINIPHELSICIKYLMTLRWRHFYILKPDPIWPDIKQIPQFYVKVEGLQLLEADKPSAPKVGGEFHCPIKIFAETNTLLIFSRTNMYTYNILAARWCNPVHNQNVWPDLRGSVGGIVLLLFL